MALIDGLISQWLANNNGDDSIGPHDMISVSPSGYSVDAKLGSHALIYDGIDDKSVVSHHADFNFGDGSSDSPFSVFQWVKMTDATIFRLLFKNIDTSNAEYSFSTLGGGVADKLSVAFYDQTTANFIRRDTTATLTGYEGTYILVGHTYDGSGSVNGIKLYVGDQRVATTPVTGGSYTAMHPLSGDVWIGAGQFGGFADGLIDTTYIWNRAITDGGIAEGNAVGAGSDIDLLWNGGAGIEIGIGVGAVPLINGGLINTGLTRGRLLN